MAHARHYCYRIDFEDGFVYFGVRSCSCDPADDTSYMGSPVTHAAKWLTDIPRVKTIVSEHETRELAMEAEAKLIRDFWDASVMLSLNATIHHKGFSWLGQSHTEETCAKLSVAQKGKPKPPRTAEHCASISASKTGIPLTAEHRTKLSEISAGVPKTAETRERMSKAQTGMKRTAEHCASISAACKGRELSAEHSSKLLEANIGSKWYTDGATSIRIKLGDAVPEGFCPGRTKSAPETCAKLSESHKGKKWYTDGTSNVQLKLGATAPEGFKPGLTKRSRNKPAQ